MCERDGVSKLMIKALEAVHTDSVLVTVNY